MWPILALFRNRRQSGNLLCRIQLDIADIRDSIGTLIALTNWCYLSGRIGRLLLLEIDCEVTRGKARSFLVLPAVVASRRADQLYVISLTGLEQPLSVHVALVSDVGRGQELVPGQLVTTFRPGQLALRRHENTQEVKNLYPVRGNGATPISLWLNCLGLEVRHLYGHKKCIHPESLSFREI